MADQKKGTQLADKDGNIVKAAVKSPFGDVILTLSDNDSVYAGTRGSGPSTTVLEYSLPISVIGGGNMTVGNRVYGRLQPSGKMRIDVSLPKGIKLDSDLRDAFKSHVNEAISKWADRGKAFRTAHTRLTEPPKPVKAGEKVGAAPVEWAPDDEQLAATA